MFYIFWTILFIYAGVLIKATSEGFFTYTQALISLIIFFLIASISLIKRHWLKQKRANLSLAIIDQMDGAEFEDFIYFLYDSAGINIYATPKSRDQGGDLVIKHRFSNTVIQAKRYKSKVGNKAVQEVVAAKAYYSCNKGIVITNNFYTKSAQTLAEANNIKLINRKKLKKMINQYDIAQNEYLDWQKSKYSLREIKN